MKTATALRVKDSKVEGEVLYVALELGKNKWKVGSTVGLGQKAREVDVRGGDVQELMKEVERAKERFGLAEGCGVVSCYEAGRDGFWLHRFLMKQGIKNRVVDSSSIEVNRRARRAKSDGLDVRKLLKLLIRHWLGEKKVWSVVRVPEVAEEDGKQLHRELMELKRERVRVTNRMRGLLYTQGVRREKCGKDFVGWLQGVRLWDGSGLAQGLRERLEREYERVELLRRQIRELQAKQREGVRKSTVASNEKVRKLMQLRGVGLQTSWLYTMEIFGWREIRNRREVGALSGLVPSPYQSGSSVRDQGISKAGVRYVRAYAVEHAWLWVRLQPDSELSQWYQRRFAHGSGRMRKVGIVAVARKLLIALWRYLEMDEVPKGAVLKGA